MTIEQATTTMPKDKKMENKKQVERKGSSGMSSEASLSISNDDLRMRVDSESSDDGLAGIEPLDIDDICRYADLSGSYDSLDSIDENGDAKISLFSVAMSLRRQKTGKPMPLNMRPQNRATKNWLKALHLTSKHADPWEKFHFDDMPAEKAVRHKYNALSKTWTTEEVVVKIDKESFAAGAMRECFRMKKLSNFSQNQNWARDSNNYVAKSYMDEDVPKETYFADVRLQMDAKLWGEEFNRHNPPKKVDIFMMCVLEFVDRAGQPLFHVEHYIDGEYVKYNSNSGYVDCRLSRQTPHAFSHFTFERSGHELIVVDVQGVGDLYTDPQIHTLDGQDYGDGNLGVKGMALFFHSHSCNAICKSLGLQSFDLAPKERESIMNSSSSKKSDSQTVLRGQEVLCETPSDVDRADHFEQFFRQRSSSIDFGRSMSVTSQGSSNGDCFMVEVAEEDQTEDKTDNQDFGLRKVSFAPPAMRRRLTTGFSETNEDELKSFQERIRKKSKPANLSAEIQTRLVHDDSILGQVHLALVKYHEVCRFTDDGTYDREAAMFHLKAAADCGIVAAIVSLARMYCGLPHDILSDVTLDEDNSITEAEKSARGLKFMEKAAMAKDRAAMIFMAKAYHLGMNTGVDPDMALYWYETIIDFDEDGGCDTEDMSLDDPTYILLARSAELWMSGNLRDGRDPSKSGELYNQAAEVAMACMKGKLANKYYMLAEEAWGQVEE